MVFFNKKKDDDFDAKDDYSDDEEFEKQPRKIRDLKPENKRSRKEPLKPWDKKERLIVLITLLATVLISGILALSARNFKLPKLPYLNISSIKNLNPFKEQVIIVGNKGSSVSQEKIENTKKLFKEATYDYSGIYAFYIYDLNGDYYYGTNYQEVMQAASLIKLPVMTATYKEINDGKLDANKYLPLIEAMGKRSDNTSFNELVKVLGKERINKEINDLGMPNTQLSENKTTPEEIGMFFKKLYKNEILNEKDSDILKDFMTDTIFEDWLRPGIPSEIELVHKYGREVHVVNDAGIVESDRPFVMVIMTDGVIEKEADELFPKLSKLLYDNHISK
ncbi:MAG TPA: serine hydrolase [Patescibacteria group bacterium]|nr:serine hydrolase [Patescibacteria group bacterium]